MRIIKEIPGGVILNTDDAARIFGALMAIAHVGLTAGKDAKEAKELRNIALEIGGNLSHFPTEKSNA